MDIKLDQNQTYTTNEGLELICYETTEKFAFLCPYRLLDENRVELNIAKTMIYPMDCPKELQDTPIEAIETMIVEK